MQNTCTNDCLQCGFLEELEENVVHVIEVTCQRCHTMQVTPDYMFLIPKTHGGTSGSYVFQCPGCDERGVCDVGEADFLKLYELGVEVLPDLSETYIIFFSIRLAEISDIPEAAKNFQ